MKLLTLVLFLALTMSSTAQNYSLSQLITAFKTDSSLTSNQIKLLVASNKAKSEQIVVLQAQIYALQHDTIPFDSKNFLIVNGMVTFIGSSISQKWVDSINNVLVQNSIDQKQLFSNDIANAKATSDTGKNAIARSKTTDSTVSVTRTAMISYYGLSKSYTDAQLIPINASLTTVQTAQGLTAQQLKDLATKTESLAGTIPKGVTINGTLTY